MHCRRRAVVIAVMPLSSLLSSSSAHRCRLRRHAIVVGGSCGNSHVQQEFCKKAVLHCLSLLILFATDTLDLAVSITRYPVDPPRTVIQFVRLTVQPIPQLTAVWAYEEITNKDPLTHSECSEHRFSQRPHTRVIQVPSTRVTFQEDGLYLRASESYFGFVCDRSKNIVSDGC